MEHKAFLFDYGGFDRELRSILEEALRSGRTDRLIDFIEANRKSLKDPYEGAPLAANWQEQIETKDPHQFGDFALTKYYDPSTDIGLGPKWDEAQRAIPFDPQRRESPVLGMTVGPSNSPFDPGKMGAYFQSEQQARRNAEYVSRLAQGKSSEVLTETAQMLSEASRMNRGLYVTF